MDEMQNYQNHTRWYPLFHFAILPLLLVCLVWAIVCVVMEFEWYRVHFLLLTIAVVLLAFASRLQALKAQDRVIRLEEHLRYKAILPADLLHDALKLSPRNVIALRFASDEELLDLVRRVINGEFGSSKEIKLAIKSWRSDHHRV